MAKENNPRQAGASGAHGPHEHGAPRAQAAAGAQAGGSKEQEVQKLSYELAMYEHQAKHVESDIKQIQEVINSLSFTMEALKNLKKDKGSLYSIGGGVLVKGKVTEDADVLYDIGAGTFLEIPKDEAVTRISEKLDALRNEYNEKNALLSQLVSHLERLNMKAREIIGGEGAEEEE